MRPVTSTMRSSLPRGTLPAGKFWFSSRTAFMMSLTPTRSECMRPGSSSMLIWRLTPPAMVARPTSRTVCRRLTMIWSARVVRSRTERMSERTAIDTIGWSSGLKRWISGSLTSGLKAARTCWTFSRTSCMATADGTDSSNSAMTIERPSSEREVSVLRPAMALTDSSILRLISALDRLGRGAGIVGGDHDDREVDVGELVDAELAVGEQAQHQQRHHHHGGEHRVVDGDLGELHRRRLSGLDDLDLLSRLEAGQGGGDDRHARFQALDLDQLAARPGAHGADRLAHQRRRSRRPARSRPRSSLRIAAAGTASAWSFSWTMTVPLANRPPRSASWRSVIST